MGDTPPQSHTQCMDLYGIKPKNSVTSRLPFNVSIKQIGILKPGCSTTKMGSSMSGQQMTTDMDDEYAPIFEAPLMTLLP